MGDTGTDDVDEAVLQAVAHDLRTPLAAILGLSATLERTDIDLDAEEGRDLAGRIAASARRLDRMLSDLLDLDRLARGIVEPEPLATDVGALVRRVVAASELTPRGLVDVDAPSLNLSVDAPRVERIVENLLANAVQRTPSGARMWVRVEPAQGGALIVVEDEGRRVPEEHREAIFEPPRRGPGALDRGPSAGVGLTLVARFARLIGGRAWVQDREGGGASFRVFLADAAGSRDAGAPG